MAKQLGEVFVRDRSDEGDPREALQRLLDASWQLTVDQFPLLLAVAPPPDSIADSMERHRGVLEPFEALMRRGQVAGVFDPDVPATWLVTMAVTLTDAAWADISAGRLTPEEGRRFSQAAVLRAVTA